MERLERDVDALSEHYAGMVPETLDSLTFKEHHGISNMLPPRVMVSADGALEITDVFGRPLEACALRSAKTEGVSLRTPEADRTPALGFRALLTENVFESLKSARKGRGGVFQQAVSFHAHFGE